MTRLSQFLKGTFSDGLHVVCLQSEQYPLLFGRKFTQYVAEKRTIPFAYQSMKSDNQAATMAALQTSFLGSHSCYWLGSLDELPKSKQQQWIDFFSTYTGPHYLVFSTAISCASIQTIEVVEVPHALDAASLSSISPLFAGKSLSFKGDLFLQTDKLSVDELCLFMEYDAVLGRGASRFAKEWLSQMVVPELSLFSLSQALFDRKAASFFRLWKQLAQKYGAPFWITFWSEQMWRAYHYVALQQKGKQAEAKKVGYRLPFSFLNRTWRRYSLDELQQLHHFLYDIDFHIKNGGHAYALDLFYATLLV
jgi:hypothetical protein